MSEQATKPSIRDRIKWWIYERCFTYCVHCIYPDADPSEFCFLDMVSFVAVSKDELREVIEDAPKVAWRFEGML